ncbi:hypothetical protein J2S13_000394 [Oikeobacillus pervagus]|uniref:Uncharacterized protein n=1 Tax=Oikeobacillus pervagus TaxID=1325931 RepID=A0AAJ1T125_9BACI|nr:hypothetical protein [Oikeobacillus pervagus]MDQ0213999.1 hypothetical protein [Oikeobacillus pervagus]
MKRISSQSYFTVKRRIEWNKQYSVEVQHSLDLFEDKIVTSSQSFFLKDVFDLSYKPFSTGTGILYLHTNQGVFPFQIQSNPQDFIEAFRVLK